MVMRGNTSIRGRGRGGRGGRGRGGSRGRGYWVSRGQYPNARTLSVGGSDLQKSVKLPNVPKKSDDHTSKDFNDQYETRDNIMNRNIDDKLHLNMKKDEVKRMPIKDERNEKLFGDESKNSSTENKSISNGPKENKSKSSKGKKGKRKKFSSVHVDGNDEATVKKSTMPKQNKRGNPKAEVGSKSDKMNDNLKICKNETVLESPDGTFTMSPISELSISPRISEKEISKNLEVPTVEFSHCISRSTGLYVFSVTHVKPGHIVTLLDRAKIVKAIPGVILMNIWGKGDSLIVGVDCEKSKLQKMLGKVSEQLTEWMVSPLDVGNKDVFGFLSGWTEIPRVDGVGLYQLVVKFNSNDSKGSKREELIKRNQLLSLISNFNVSKIVHGEGESIIQVCHILELASYTDSIQASFSVEKRHCWHPRPVDNNPPSHECVVNDEIYLWLKMNSSELSPAHEQFSVFHSLSTAGYNVRHLEHQLFGTPGNYLVALNIPSKEDSTKQAVESINHLCPQFTFLELNQEYLPDQYRPNYMVDNHGFYSVSGTFPSKISPELRNKFAEDMKNIGAVGFRVDESNSNLFSLHFVNSRCLDNISRDSQFSMFGLVIQSNKVKKLVAKDILKILVPSILKYKEIIKANNEKEENNSVFKEKTVATAFPKVLDKSSTEVMNGKEVLFESVDKTHKSTKENVKRVSKKVISPNIEKNLKVDSIPIATLEPQSASLGVTLSSDELFSLKWKNSSNIHNYLGCFVNFIQKFDNLTMTEESESFSVMFPSVAELEKVLFSLCLEETNTVEKLRNMLPVVRMEPSKFFKNKFGLLVKKIPAGKLGKYFESFGPIAVESRSNCAVAWFDSQVDLMKALVLGLKKQKTSGASSTPNESKFTLSCNNFYFRTETNRDKSMTGEPEESTKHAKLISSKEKIDGVMVGIQDKRDEVMVNTPEKIDGEIFDNKHKFILTEKEIFGFYWKSQRQDRSEEKAYSRYLTNFIKTVKCFSLSTNEDGLVAKFSNQSDLEETVKRFCKESNNSPSKLLNLSPSFTLIPSRGYYGLYSVKRVKPEHFAKINDCKAGNNSVWFQSKLDLVQTLRDPLIMKIYPALWIDCRNVYILQRNHQSSSPSVISSDSQKVGVTTRSTVSREQVVKSDRHSEPVINISDNIGANPAFVSTGIDDEKNADLGTCTSGVSMLAAWKRDLVDKDNLRKVTPRQAASVIGKAIEGNDVGDQGASLREIKMNRVEDFLKEKLGLSNLDKVPENVPVLDDDKILEKEEEEFIKEVEISGQMICNLESVFSTVETFVWDGIEKVKVDEDNTVIPTCDPKSPEGLETKISLLEKTALIFPTVMKMDNIAINPAEKVERDQDNDESAVVKEACCQVAELKDGIYVEEVSYGSEDLSRLETSHLKDDVIYEINKDKDITTMSEEKTEIINTAHEDCSIAETNDEFISKEVVTNYVGNNDTTWKCKRIGFYTMLICLNEDENVDKIHEIEEDFAWFDNEVRISLVDKSPVHSKRVEVKMNDLELASAALAGLKHKYPSLVKKQVDFKPDKETGLYTLSFSDIQKKRFKATMEHFKHYSGPGEDPKISRGEEKDQVLVSYATMEEAELALVNNLENEQFPNLQITQACLTEI